MSSLPTPTMPPAVAEVFRPLRLELNNIHVRWRLFVQLFGTDEDRVRLLNRFAAGLFGTVQASLYDDVVLSLFRLKDPAKSRGHENLSLERLCDEIAKTDPALGASIRTRIGRVHSLLMPHEGWRNKRTAHNDLATAKARYLGASGLSGPSREDIVDVLRVFSEGLDEVEACYGEGTTGWGELLPLGDGDTLIRHLMAHPRAATLPRDAPAGAPRP